MYSNAIVLHSLLQFHTTQTITYLFVEDQVSWTFHCCQKSHLLKRLPGGLTRWTITNYYRFTKSLITRLLTLLPVHMSYCIMLKKVSTEASLY